MPPILTSDLSHLTGFKFFIEDLEAWAPSCLWSVRQDDVHSLIRASEGTLLYIPGKKLAQVLREGGPCPLEGLNSAGIPVRKGARSGAMSRVGQRPLIR